MIAVVWAAVDHWAIDDCSIRAVVVDLVAVVGLPNDSVVGTIVGTMALADAMAVAFVHGIVGNWCSVDDGSSVDLARPRAMLLLLKLALYPNDAMELELVLAAVHGI